jgi:hypothetical protein
MAPIRLGLVRRGLHDCSPSFCFLLPSQTSTNYRMSGRYIAPNVYPPMRSVKVLLLGVRFLRFGVPETAGGDEMYEHDQ